jgi:cytidylate kinase
MTGTNDRVVEALAHLNHYSTNPRLGAQAPLTIALSRQAGTGGGAIAHAVGARLGWPVYDHELLERIAEESGLDAHLLQRLDERDVSWVEEAARIFFAPRGHVAANYLRGLRRLVDSLSRSGHCVIVGHGACQVLPRETTLTVRLIGPRKMSIAWVQKTLGLSEAEAERWIDRTERERLRFVERHFNANEADPFGYDLVLNRERLSMDGCTELIVQALRTREAHAGLD